VHGQIQRLGLGSHGAKTGRQHSLSERRGREFRAWSGPKIFGLLLVMKAVDLNVSMLAVAAAMAIGGLLNAHKVTRDHEQEDIPHE
jgi:hypothetical protein